MRARPILIPAACSFLILSFIQLQCRPFSIFSDFPFSILIPALNRGNIVFPTSRSSIFNSLHTPQPQLSSLKSVKPSQNFIKVVRENGPLEKRKRKEKTQKLQTCCSVFVVQQRLGGQGRWRAWRVICIVFCTACPLSQSAFFFFFRSCDWRN